MINFEDAVDEILTNKKKSHTEASLASRIKSRMMEETSVEEILYEDEEKSKNKKDDTSMKKRISDKEEENDLEDELKSGEEKDSDLELKKKMKKEYFENLKRDDVLSKEYADCIYKTTKDPEGDEVLRVYMRINSENVNIKRFGRSEILQFGDLNSILSKYGYSKDTLIDIKNEEGIVDAIDAASTIDGSEESKKNKRSIDSFKFVLKRISEASSSFEIACASKKNEDSNTASAVVLSLGMVTNFDTRQQALDYVDLQYSTLILKDIGTSEGV